MTMQELRKQNARLSYENKQLREELSRTKIDIELIDYIPAPLLITMVKNSVSEGSGVPVSDIVSRSRKRPLPELRAICYQLIRENEDKSTHTTLVNLGLEFGGLDHSTVLHGYKLHDDLHGLNRGYTSLYSDCMRILELKLKSNELEQPGESENPKILEEIKHEG